MHFDPGKRVTETDRNIADVVALFPGYLRLHQQEAFLPAQEHCFHSSTCANQVFFDLPSELRSQRGIAQHELVSPEDFGEARVDLALHPSRQGEEIICDRRCSCVQTRQLVFDFVSLDVLGGDAANRATALSVDRSSRQTRGHGCSLENQRHSSFVARAPPRADRFRGPRLSEQASGVQDPVRRPNGSHRASIQDQARLGGRSLVDRLFSGHGGQTPGQA